MDPYKQLKAQEDYYDKLAAKIGKKDREEERKLRRAMVKADKEDYKAQAKLPFTNEKANASPSTSAKPKASPPSQASVRKTPSLLNTQSASKNVGGARGGFMVAINKWKDLFS